MRQKIFVTKSFLPPFEEYIEEIKPLWESHFITNMGSIHQELERRLTDYLKVDHLSLMTNGHLALELAIQAMNLPAESEVITTPFTFISTTHAIVRNGLTPVFCDINPEDYTIDCDKIEALITERTSAILPVHVYGNICDVDKIQKIAARHGLKVIYDAAHTFGELYKGNGIGNYGDMSIFSFHATKVYNTVEGGAVVYHEEERGRQLKDLKNFGFRGELEIDGVGSNAKMDEFRAAMGLCNLRYVDQTIAQRRTVFERYREHLSNKTGIRLQRQNKDIQYNYAYFPVVFDGYKKSRDEIAVQLKEQDIYARKYFYPITSNAQCFGDRFKDAHVETACYISDRVLTLPIYPDLALEDVDRICEIILS